MNDEQRGESIYMVNTCPDGTYIQERVMQHATHIIKKELGYEKFDFHSLRRVVQQIAIRGFHFLDNQRAGVQIRDNDLPLVVGRVKSGVLFFADLRGMCNKATDFG